MSAVVCPPWCVSDDLSDGVIHLGTEIAGEWEDGATLPPTTRALTLQVGQSGDFEGITEIPSIAVDGLADHTVNLTAKGARGLMAALQAALSGMEGE